MNDIALRAIGWLLGLALAAFGFIVSLGAVVALVMLATGRLGR